MPHDFQVQSIEMLGDLTSGGTIAIKPYFTSARAGGLLLHVVVDMPDGKKEAYDIKLSPERRVYVVPLQTMKQKRAKPKATDASDGGDES